MTIKTHKLQQAVQLAAGKYILAVSGGVDSMTLLNLLSNQPAVELVVAHFNHGIRKDAYLDEELVSSVAQSLNLSTEIGQAKLGSNASEAKARTARYEFLEQVKSKHAARAIITAHHQDDLLETAVINLLRGTGWRGMVAIARNPNIIRPLLNVPKTEILQYAKAHKLGWNEDDTNSSSRYLRNRVRQQIIPKLNASDRLKLLQIINQLVIEAPKIDNQLSDLSRTLKRNSTINRRAYTKLPSVISDELMLNWLKQADVEAPDRKLVNRLSVAVKSAKSGTKHNVASDLWLEVSNDSSKLVSQSVKRA